MDCSAVGVLREAGGMYLGELGVGAIIFHARWGIGRVARRDETCVVCRFGTHRRKLAYNDKVAVWARLSEGVGTETIQLQRAA